MEILGDSITQREINIKYRRESGQKLENMSKYYRLMFTYTNYVRYDRNIWEHVQ